jgi:hypothetical protein
MERVTALPRETDAATPAPPIRGILCAVAAALTLGACAGGSLHPFRDTAGPRAEGGSDSVRVDAQSDSVSRWSSTAADLLESDLPDGTRDESAASQASDAAPDIQPKGGSYEVTAVAGFRSEVRLRAGDMRGFSGGVRVGESFTMGYVRYEGRGFLRALHVGRMTIRAGERLLLGRGLGDYGSSTTGRVREGFAVSPSLSQWFGFNGAAVELAGGPWRFQTLAFTPPDAESRFERGSAWSSVVRDFSRGSLGVMAALVKSRSSEATAGPAATRLSTVGAHTVFGGQGFDGSGEVARLGSEWYFAGRIRTTARRARWSLLVFDAPFDVPPGGPGMEPPARRDHGAALSVSSRILGLKGSLRLFAGQRVSRSGRADYRRLIAEVDRGGPGPVRWSLRASAKTCRETDFPTNPVVRELSVESSRELALRAALSIDDRRAVRTAARIDYLPPTDQMGSGTVVSVSVNAATARIDASMSATSHSLAPGRRAFVTRPGLGPYEWFGSLYGKGSDLSFRVGLRLSPDSRLIFFYASPWRGVERAYAGIECRR